MIVQVHFYGQNGKLHNLFLNLLFCHFAFCILENGQKKNRANTPGLLFIILLFNYYYFPTSLLAAKKKQKRSLVLVPGAVEMYFTPF